jgi:DNA-binding winged helix-turn-helix (wHTH) protein/tetratricopeptide (TPR) repeat protein
MSDAAHPPERPPARSSDAGGTPASLEPGIAFGPFRISPDVDLLYRGSAVVALEPRAVQVLRYLASRPGRVLSKRELLDGGWPGLFVTDDVLKQAVAKIRRALGSRPDGGAWIQTYHARGYQFVVEPTVAGAVPASGPPSSAAPPSGAAPRDAGPGAPDFDQLVGRDAELALLRAEFAATRAGAARPLLVLGDAGAGKTQLTRVFLRLVRAQGARALRARFFDYEASRLAPYEALLDLLAAALDDDDDASSRVEPAADLAARVRDRLGVELPPELTRRAGGAAVAAPDATRAAAALAAAFRRLARARPLVLVFDDVQWADDAALAVIGHLARTADEAALLVVAVARAEDLDAGAGPLAAWRARQADVRAFGVVRLGPLDPAGVAAVVAAVFGGPDAAPRVPERDVRALHASTGGNPYFVAELLRLLLASGRVARGADGRWAWHGLDGVALPDSVADAALAKLGRLAPDTRVAVDAAAVVGDEGRIGTLARTLGTSRARAAALVADAARTGVLTTRGTAPGEDYRFTHGVLRRACFDALAPGARRRLHARVARALGRAYAAEPSRVAAAVASHAEAAGRPAATLRWAVQAARAAVARGRGESAHEAVVQARRAEAALAAAGRPAAAAMVRGLRQAEGEVALAAGAPREAAAALADAAALARALGDDVAEADARLALARAHVALGDYARALVEADAAHARWAAVGDAVGAARALVQLAVVRTSLGEYAAVDALVDEALGVLEAHEAAGDAVAVALAIRGWALALRGDVAAAVPVLERAAERHARAGDPRQAAHVRRRLAWAHHSAGRYARAAAVAEQARADFRAAGDRFGEAKADMAIGQTRVEQGLFDEGIAALRRTLDALAVTGDVHCEAEARWLTGRAHAEAGRTAAARPFLDDALALVRQVGDRDDEFRVLVDRARARRQLGELAGAHDDADAGLTIARALGSRDGVGLALAERSLVRAALGRAAESVTDAQSAAEALDAVRSGERWRAHHALAAVRRIAGDPAGALIAARAAVAVLEGVRAELADDPARHAAVTRARSAPAALLAALLADAGYPGEARATSAAWAPGPP